MMRLLTICLVVIFATSIALPQGKGVDKQSERVRDSGTTRLPAGTGRGIDFGRDRTPETPPIPNPYRLGARRDVIMNAVQEVMRDQRMILDEAASRPEEGILVSQPFTFIKGAVVSQSELGRYAAVSSTTSRGWTRGRYTLTVEVQPIDATSANVSVNAKIEGRTDGATGAEWTTLPSLGTAEEEFLAELITKITGGPPPGWTR